MIEFFATLAAGLWAGAALYIAISEHPSALKVGVGFATEYFRFMSKRTAPLMMVLSAIGGSAGLFAWYQSGEAGWLIGAVLLLGMFPFTGLLIVPTNWKLLKVDTKTDETTALALHRKWARMHNLRTLLGVPAFLIFLWLLIAPAA